MVKFSRVWLGIATASLLVFAVGSSDATQVRAFYELRYGELDTAVLALERARVDSGHTRADVAAAVSIAIAGVLVPLVGMRKRNVAESDDV